MSAPSAFDRVLAGLKRMFPLPVTITRSGGAAPAAGDSRIGRELGSIAWVLARVADRIDAMETELFPDTADESISRWEFVTRVASNALDALAMRQNKVLATLRREGGTRIDQIAKALSTALDCDDTDLQFYETLRVQLDAMMTDVITDAWTLFANVETLIPIGKPWPGLVDDTGVTIEITTSSTGGTDTYYLEHSDGTRLALPDGGATSFTITDRTTFLGKPASGPWKLRMLNTSGINLTFASLTVSNDQDAGQIYSYYVYRDPALGGSPDLAEADRIINRTSLAHMNGSVTQETDFIVDDDDCLVDRTPVS